MNTVASQKNATIETFSDYETLSEAAALFIAGNLYQGLLTHGLANIVVTGGSTVRGIYERLSQAALAWNEVHVRLSDERWVDAQSSDSNERLVRTHLLQNYARAARFTPLKTAAETPQEAASAVNRTLIGLRGPADLVLLGMGEDGHVASLFPGHPALRRGLDVTRPKLCIAVREAHPAPVQPRLSLTLRSLLDARAVLIVACGEAKRRTFERSMSIRDPGITPVSALLCQSRVPVRFLWSP